MSAAASAQKLRCASACEACRRRKVKCSGGRPCRSCIRHTLECVSSEAAKQGYSVAHVRGLLATIRQQEQELGALRKGSPSAHKDHTPLVAPQDASNNETGEHQTTESRVPETAATELASGPAFESRARYWLRDHAQNSDHSQSPTFRTLLSGSSNEPSAGIWRDVEDLTKETSALVKVPLEADAHRLLNCFLPLMGVSQHFFDPRTFMDSMALLYQSEHTQVQQMQTLWFVQYLLVLAMGMLISCPARRPEEPPGCQYFAEAIKRLPPVYELGSNGIITVEILCLVALYLQWCDHKHDAYLYIGSAVRLALALGCSQPHDEQRGLPSEVCHRVRVWWTAYMLDRRLSAALGLPMAADDRQIRVELPRPYAGFQSPVPMIINARIARATGVIMTSFYGSMNISQMDLVQDIQETLHTLQEISSSFPSDLIVIFSGKDIAVSRTQASLYLMLFQATLLCIRPIVLQSVKDKVSSCKENRPQSTMSSITTKLYNSCQDVAAKSIMILTSLLKKRKLPFFGFFDLDAAFSTAFILVMMHFVRSDKPQSPPNGLEQAMEVLQYLARAGNVAAMQRLEDLRQFCYLAWPPEITAQWRWLEADKEDMMEVNTSVSSTAQLKANENNNTSYAVDDYWSEGRSEWFTEPTNFSSNNVVGETLFPFDFGEKFEVDLAREAEGIYTSFNDPSLPLTGNDQTDWVELEKMFRL